LEQRDVNVLKLLYLIRYIDDIKANIDNIAILMVDDIRTDKITLRREITESLERLEGKTTWPEMAIPTHSSPMRSRTSPSISETLR
jgi:hypothetical protein